MPQKFLVKRSSVEDKVPAAGDLDTGELALNLKDQKLFSKDADGNVFEIGQTADLSNYLEKGDNVSDLTNDAGYITVDEIPEVTGFVKLDDEGTQQSIVGGGGLDLAGSLIVDSSVRVNTTESSGRPGLAVNGDLSINTGGYDLRLFGGNNFDLDNVTATIIGRDAFGETQIKASGGWGDNVYLTMSTSAFIMGNNNPNKGPDPISGSTAHCHAWGGLNTEFGTNTAQLGNVAPLNDWSCYPARA